jgi:hypothetical protein
MAIRNFKFKKESSYKDEEDCLERVLDTYTPFPPTLMPIILFATFQNGNKKLFLGRKNIGGALFPPLPQAMPLLRSIVVGV